MNAHANTTSFANTDIIIENVFSYDDVLKLSGYAIMNHSVMNLRLKT